MSACNWFDHAVLCQCISAKIEHNSDRSWRDVLWHRFTSTSTYQMRQDSVYRSFPSSLLRPSTVDGLEHYLHYCSCNVIQCGERPGESHEGVGRKTDAARQRLAGFGSYPWIWECYPCGLHSVSFWLGEPWFPHCASVAFWLTDCCMALCGLLFRFVLHCHTSPWGDTMLSSLLLSNCPSTKWSADHRRCWFLFLFWFVLFAFGVFVGLFVWVFGVCFVLHGDSSMYRSNSVLFCITLSLWLRLMLLLH